MMDVQCVFFSYTGTTPAPYSDRPADNEDDGGQQQRILFQQLLLRMLKHNCELCEKFTKTLGIKKKKFSLETFNN